MKKNKMVISIIVVIVLILTVVSVTYAYFSASTTNNDTVVGNTSTSQNLSLEIGRVDTATGDLIPMNGEYLSKGIENNCVDDNGNTVCHVYEIKLTNGPNPTGIDGSISFTSDSVNIVYGILETNEEDSLDINSLKSTLITEGTSYDTENDLAYDVAYEANETMYYYVVVWLNETNTAQDEEDSSKSYTGTVAFNATGGGGITATFGSPSCFAKGTKITMSDGSVKNIEDIKVGDSVRNLNHMTGEYENSEVYIAYEGENKSNAFTLHFDNGTDLSIVGIHDLFEKETMKYVNITSDNAEEYIGHHFYSTSVNDFVTLTSVTRDINNTEYYSIYAEYNHNSIANGMLSVPDDIDFYLNVFEYNNDLTINKDILNSDVEKYGWYDTSNLKGYKDFELENAKYLNIIIGKGLSTLEEIKGLRSEYNEE